ncbi:MAG: DMT family transporter [Planctomycetota bacterium]|nr:DMT family transporter [Planctomycetota bacterium]
MAYVWMLIGSIAFAFMALLTESLREQFSFPWITIVRSGVATILALGLAMVFRAQLVFLRPGSLWVRSISGWLAMICGFYAMTHYDVEIVLALTNMYPLWVAVLSWPLLRVMPSWRTWVALVISCVGMWIVYTSAIQPVRMVSSDLHVPEVAIPLAVLAAILSGVALINLHKVRSIDPRAIVTHFSGVATFCSLLVWIFLPVSLPTREVDSISIWSLIGVGVAATIGQLCLTRAFAAGPPARVSVVGLSQVVVAGLMKWILEGRIPSMGSLVGMSLVLGATVWVIVGGDNAKKL